MNDTEHSAWAEPSRADGITAEDARPSNSRRDPTELRAQVDEWLKHRPDIADASVSDLTVPESNGMSSETIMVDARWSESGGPIKTHRLVFRLAPDLSSVPIFESYDLELQFRLITDIAACSTIPLPKAIWYEADPSHVGSQFFVMERCDGEVPTDVLPYNFGDSFLYDASSQDQNKLQNNSIALLAELHGIDSPVERFPYFAEHSQVDSTATNLDALSGLIDRMRAHYRYVTGDGPNSPLIDAAFDWIDTHWGELNLTAAPVLLWGDSRIGNVLYRDFEPVAVLDWEMALIGPRELDVSWMIFMHQFFEEVARQLDLPGMPGFMRHDDVVATYVALTGHEPANMDFFAVVSALQHGIIMSQVGRRALAFSGGVLPDDLDDLIMHRRLLAEYIA